MIIIDRFCASDLSVVFYVVIKFSLLSETVVFEMIKFTILSRIVN